MEAMRRSLLVVLTASFLGIALGCYNTHGVCDCDPTPLGAGTPLHAVPVGPGVGNAPNLLPAETIQKMPSVSGKASTDTPAKVEIKNKE
jgi:hypothetical protein